MAGAASTSGVVAGCLRRLVVASAGMPLGRLWLVLYAAAARAGAAYLTRGEQDVSVYARSSYGTREFVPGLSDVDLAIVVGGNAEAVRRRWARVNNRLPLIRWVLDWPRIYGQDELRDFAGESAFTYGLESDRTFRSDRGVYLVGGNADMMRMLERPGLYGATADWRLLRGRERRPPARTRDAQATRIAAWDELVYVWRLLFRACVEPPGLFSTLLTVKTVAGVAQIWLWLAHRERAATRAEALTRARARLPEEEDAFCRALALERLLARRHDGALAALLPAVVRLSSRITSEIAAQIAGTSATAVRLVGADPPRLLTQSSPPFGALPLCDWRALAYPPPLDQSFVPVAGEPGALARLVELIRTQRGRSYAALRAGGDLRCPADGLSTGEIIVLPAPHRPLELSRQRSIKCAASDPVSFALARGQRVARFPDVAGWSARDIARRAVAEHRAWLRDRADDLALLLTAARAACFLDSLERDVPELLLTLTQVGETIGAEDAIEAHRAWLDHGAQPPARVVERLRKLVSALPAYA